MWCRGTSPGFACRGRRGAPPGHSAGCCAKAWPKSTGDFDAKPCLQRRHEKRCCFHYWEYTQHHCMLQCVSAYTHWRLNIRTFLPLDLPAPNASERLAQQHCGASDHWHLHRKAHRGNENLSSELLLPTFQCFLLHFEDILLEVLQTSPVG